MWRWGCGAEAALAQDRLLFLCNTWLQEAELNPSAPVAKASRGCGERSLWCCCELGLMLPAPGRAQSVALCPWHSGQVGLHNERARALVSSQPCAQPLGPRKVARAESGTEPSMGREHHREEP